MSDAYVLTKVRNGALLKSDTSHSRMNFFNVGRSWEHYLLMSRNLRRCFLWLLPVRGWELQVVTSVQTWQNYKQWMTCCLLVWMQGGAGKTSVKCRKKKKKNLISTSLSFTTETVLNPSLRSSSYNPPAAQPVLALRLCWRRKTKVKSNCYTELLFSRRQ